MPWIGKELSVEKEAGYLHDNFAASVVKFDYMQTRQIVELEITHACVQAGLYAGTGLSMPHASSD